MYNEKEVQTLFFVIALLGSIIIAWPVIQTYLPSTVEEKYTELFILGSTREADNYPYLIQPGENYGIYAFVVNHRDVASFYQLQLKLRSSNAVPPNSIEGIPSEQDPIMHYPILLSDEEEWEKAIIFSFPEISKTDDTIHIKEMEVGDAVIPIDKTFPLDSETGSKVGLFFELWLLDELSSSFQYDNRFVEIWLNIPQT